MITQILIGSGIALLIAGWMALLPLGKKGVIFPIIGAILLIIGILIITGEFIDCQNYCQCKGHNYYKYWEGLRQCECFDENPYIIQARRQCNAYCFNKIADYNEATDRCYCT